MNRMRNLIIALLVISVLAIYIGYKDSNIDTETNSVSQEMDNASQETKADDHETSIDSQETKTISQGTSNQKDIDVLKWYASIDQELDILSSINSNLEKQALYLMLTNNYILHSYDVWDNINNTILVFEFWNEYIYETEERVIDMVNLDKDYRIDLSDLNTIVNNLKIASDRLYDVALEYRLIDPHSNDANRSLAELRYEIESTQELLQDTGSLIFEKRNENHQRISTY
ncbi:MAG: hypothetical protein GX317_07510 [Staphylococcus equorum]|jgi:predicted RND superfamily exporter protein|nr:hypothetical protein [Staphylococcus equorum]